MLQIESEPAAVPEPAEPLIDTAEQVQAKAEPESPPSEPEPEPEPEREAEPHPQPEPESELEAEPEPEHEAELEPEKKVCGCLLTVVHSVVEADSIKHNQIDSIARNFEVQELKVRICRIQIESLCHNFRSSVFSTGYSVHAILWAPITDLT